CALFFFFQAEDGIRDRNVTGVQTCALPISPPGRQLPNEHTARKQRLMRSLCFRRIQDRVRLTGSSGAAADPRRWAAAPAGGPPEIGRASCRERVERAGAGGAVRETRERRGE